MFDRGFQIDIITKWSGLDFCGCFCTQLWISASWLCFDCSHSKWRETGQCFVCTGELLLVSRGHNPTTHSPPSWIKSVHCHVPARPTRSPTEGPPAAAFPSPAGRGGDLGPHLQKGNNYDGMWRKKASRRGRGGRRGETAAPSPRLRRSRPRSALVRRAEGSCPCQL